MWFTCFLLLFSHGRLSVISCTLTISELILTSLLTHLSSNCKYIKLELSC